MINNFDRPFTFDRVIRIIITLVFFVILFYFISNVKGALIPFFVAWLFAYMINPIVLWVHKKTKLKNKILSIIIVLISITAIIVVALYFIIPSITDEFKKIVTAGYNFFVNKKFTDTIPLSWQHYLADNDNIKSLIGEISSKDLGEIAYKLLKWVWSFISDSISVMIVVFGWFITLIYVVFILMDYDKISEGALNLIPARYRDKVSVVMSDLEVAMNRYFRGQALVASIVGVMLAIGFKIIGIPMGIPLGLFMGLLNMVPYLQLAGIIPTIFLCLLKSVDTSENFWMIFICAIVVMVIVQLIQDLILTPKIMGKITGLNPAIILLSLSIWGSLLGILGMIIALPITTLLLSYYNRFIHNLDTETKEYTDKNKL